MAIEELVQGRDITRSGGAHQRGKRVEGRVM